MTTRMEDATINVCARDGMVMLEVDGEALVTWTPATANYTAREILRANGPYTLKDGDVMIEWTAAQARTAADLIARAADAAADQHEHDD